jgi:hypothetical protein
MGKTSRAESLILAAVDIWNSGILGILLASIRKELYKAGWHDPVRLSLAG